MNDREQTAVEAEAEAEAEADRVALLQAIGFPVEAEPAARDDTWPFAEPGQPGAGGATRARPHEDAADVADAPTEVLLAPDSETRVLPAAELTGATAVGASVVPAVTEVLPADGLRPEERDGPDAAPQALPAVGELDDAEDDRLPDAEPSGEGGGVALETRDGAGDAAPGATGDPVPAAPAEVGREDASDVPVHAAAVTARGAAAPEPEAVDEHAAAETVLRIDGLTKRFGRTVAVDDIRLDVSAGSFYGIVGPNGAGKTTTLSMVTGLLRPDAGTVQVHGIDVWRDPEHAKRTIGVLPDALRLFDRLTGGQLLYYAGVLRGLDGPTVKARTADLVGAFGLEDAARRVVADYSAGMTKKIALATAMIHSPRLLVLDEPFESVDPVSAANIIDILERYVASGGTVVLSSHGMDLIQRVCDHVAVIIGGRVLAAGTTDEVRGEQSLEERFVELAGGRKAAEGMEWLHSFTD